MSNDCHECGEHCVDCICDKKLKCEKCKKIRMRWDTVCFDCLIDDTKQMKKRAKEHIKRLENEK